MHRFDLNSQLWIMSTCSTWTLPSLPVWFFKAPTTLSILFGGFADDQSTTTCCPGEILLIMLKLDTAFSLWLRPWFFEQLQILLTVKVARLDEMTFRFWSLQILCNWLGFADNLRFLKLKSKIDANKVYRFTSHRYETSLICVSMM